MRNRSGMFKAPELRMSSWVITKIAAATCDNFCSFFEAEVTSKFIRSSMLVLVRSFCGVSDVWPKTAGPDAVHKRINCNPLVHVPNLNIRKAFCTMRALCSLSNVPNDFCHHASFNESVKRRVISKFLVPRSQEVLSRQAEFRRLSKTPRHPRIEPVVAGDALIR